MSRSLKKDVVWVLYGFCFPCDLSSMCFTSHFDKVVHNLSCVNLHLKSTQD